MPKYPTWRVNSSEKLPLEYYGSIQAHQCKTPLCSELGQKQDLKLILKVGTLIAYILFMTTLNFQCSTCSLLLSKVIRVQSEQDNQVYKEMKGQVL